MVWPQTDPESVLTELARLGQCLSLFFLSLSQWEATHAQAVTVYLDLWVLLKCGVSALGYPSSQADRLIACICILVAKC